jgi:DNA-binding NarL/FixJ family response regulator
MFQLNKALPNTPAKKCVVQTVEGSNFAGRSVPATPDTLRARALELARQARALEMRADSLQAKAEHQAMTARCRAALREICERGRGTPAELAEDYVALTAHDLPWLKTEDALALVQAELARNTRACRARRNIEIMRLCRRGLSNKEIVSSLSRSGWIHLHPKTISRIVQTTLRETR